VLETVNSILIIYSKRLGLDSKGLGLYLDLESTFVDSSASLRILTATSQLAVHYGADSSPLSLRYVINIAINCGSFRLPSLLITSLTNHAMCARGNQ